MAGQTFMRVNEVAVELTALYTEERRKTGGKIAKKVLGGTENMRYVL